MEYEGIERRKDGWTWAKEIVGTMIGVIAIMAMPTAWFLSWSREVSTQQALNTIEIGHLKENRAAMEKKMDNTDGKLDKILEQITEMKVQAARIGK